MKNLVNELAHDYPKDLKSQEMLKNVKFGWSPPSRHHTLTKAAKKALKMRYQIFVAPSDFAAFPYPVLNILSETEVQSIPSTIDVLQNTFPLDNTGASEHF